MSTEAVAKKTSAASDVAKLQQKPLPVDSFNDYVRRLFFPGFPPGKCLGGVLFFPGRTAPTFPVPCDDEPFIVLAGGVGSDFVHKPGTAFAAAVAELAHLDVDEASRAVAEAAGITVKELDEVTAGKVARAIFTNVHRTTWDKNQFKRVPARESVASRFSRLGELQSDAMLKGIARHTGLRIDVLNTMPVAQLGDHLGAIGASTGGPVTSMARTAVCASANGSTSCGTVGGVEEGILWGGLIGGTIGGGAGAAIGALVGALISWLFGDDD